MSGDLAPAKRTRLGRRLGYLLALVWVVVGSVLYAVEVARLVIGRG
jgi:carbon starvation protein CstA